MRLKSFSAHGFKSFADKVNIDFEPGITAIVGPNGSGKSNISDAIRWVLGEQSVKYLRGTKMEDVIFAGSSGRRPMGMAEVDLVFDNTDHSLPVDFDEVSLQRRVFRSGESEYIINGKNCRLKDVVALFADTGLGRGSLSIIGQNKIDEILNSRPEDRRSIFEEAAGIAKYRLRKKEALRKLDDTAANLLRIQDIQSEIENQLVPLEAAAEKARQYGEISGRLRQVKVTRLLTQLGALEGEKTRLKEKIRSLEGQLKELADLSGKLTGQEEALEQQLQDQETAYSACQEKILAREKEAAGYRSQKAVQEERIQQSRNRMDQLAKARTGLEEELARSQENLRLVTEEYDRLEETQYRSRNLLEKAAAEKETLTGLVKAGEEKLQAYQEQAFDSMRTLVMTRNKLAGIRQEQERLHRQQEQLKEKVREAEESLEGVTGALQEEKDRLETLEDRKNQLEEQALQLNRDLEQSVRAYREKEAGLDQNRRTLNQKKARLQVLSAMEREHEGFSKGVRTVLNAQAAFRPKICGVVAELFSVEDAYVTALETALGGALQNIITQDARAAQDAIAYLKKVQGGRATFLPLDTLRPRALGTREKAALSCPGIIGIAGDLVRCEEAIRPAVRFLLGQVLVADNLDHAMAAARKADMRVRIVTLEGDVVYAGGSLSGGQKQQGKSFLSRKQEIRHLTEETQALEKAGETLRQELEDLAEKGRRVKEKRQQGVEALQKIEVEKAGAVARVQQEETQKKRQQENLELLLGEKRQGAENFLALQVQAKELAPQVEAMENADVEGKKAAQALSDGLVEQRTLLEGATRRHQDALIAVNAGQSQLEALNARIQSIDQLGEKTQQEITRGEEETRQLETTIAGCEKNRAALEKKIAGLEAELAGSDSARQQFLDAREALLARRQQLIQQGVILQGQEASIRQKLHNCEMDQVKKAAEAQHSRQQLQEAYGLTEETARQEALEGDLPEGELKKREAQAARELEELGPVNQAAQEEYQAARERYDFLKKQYQDMVQAREQLETVISGINSDMTRRFREAFKQINGYFSDCYEKLFGGGRAQLRIQDEKNLLESGIEIEAQPPGKKMRNLSLFSGGERALTVIALLFALLTYQPAPFVILDEIDAPLDETNIDRFAQFLKAYGQQTQFIVITHRKGTMEAADVLHGVTMEDSGVSRVLSVKLSEVAES